MNENQKLFRINIYSKEEQYYELDWALKTALRHASYVLTTSFPKHVNRPLTFTVQGNDSKASVYINHNLANQPVHVFQPPDNFLSFSDVETFKKWVNVYPHGPSTFIVFALDCVHPSLGYQEFIDCLPRRRGGKSLLKKTIDVVWDQMPSWMNIISHAYDTGLHRMTAIHLERDTTKASGDILAYGIYMLSDHFQAHWCK